MENPERAYDAANWLGSLSVHQDFGWFFSLLVWSLVLIAWLHHPRRRAEWTWVPAAAGATIATALIEFGLFNPTFDLFQDRLVPGSVATYRPAVIDPYWLGGVLIGFAFATMIAVWSWQATTARGWRSWRAIALLTLAGVVAMHAADAWLGGWLLCASAGLAGALFWSGTRNSLLARVGLALAIALPLTSTVGPIAAWTDTLQRNGPPTPMGVLAAAFQLALGTLVLVGLVRGAWARQHSETLPALRCEVRLTGIVAVLGLLGGVAFGVQTGRDNRREIQQNRLRATAAQARLFDPALLAPLADPRFTIETRAKSGEPGGAFAPAVASGALEAARRRLAEVVIATPFLASARLLVIHDGWLVAVLSSNHSMRSGEVELLRRAMPEDAARWREAEPYVEESPVHEIGYPYFCRAPLVAEDGRVVAWLDCVRREYYLSVERRWRAGPFVMTALGIAVLGLVVVQRQSGRERELARRAAEAAAVSNRVKSVFLANVSHELRTPLQNILGYGELLEGDTTATDRQAHLAALRQQGRLMLRLVNDLIDLSAVEVGAFQLSPQPLNPAAVGRDIVASLRPRATAKGLSLDDVVATNVPEWVSADEARLRQVLTNLLGNAVKFTERGGARLECSATPLRGGRCRLEFAVVDTGPGIPAAQQGRLFAAFSRLEQTAAKEGSGLGLAVAAALCRAMNGDLTVESDGATGCRFVAAITVPLAEAPLVAEAREGGFAAPVRLRVLVLEDNALMRDLFVSALRARGAICRSMARAGEALAAIEQEPPDVVVMDLALAEGDSVEWVPRIRALAPRSRIVVVSAHAGAAERARVLAAGVDAFLTKPVRLDELWSTVVGGAPVATALPDYFPDQPGVFHEIEAQFRRELPAWEEAARVACGARDFAAVRRHAHYLRNSALAIRASALFDACTALETAATNRDSDALGAAWRACQTELERWRPATA